MDLVKGPLFHLENKLNPGRLNLDCLSERKKEGKREGEKETVILRVSFKVKNSSCCDLRAIAEHLVYP